jgi:hypothetical protein
MKPMSIQVAREFWTYLHNQSEQYKQKYFEDGGDHAYRDEIRAAEETYRHVANEFSSYLGTPIQAASDIQSGLTAEQFKAFLGMLEQHIAAARMRQEEILRKSQAALAKVEDMEYYRVKRIYKEMNNLADRQALAYHHSREQLMRILQSK